MDIGDHLHVRFYDRYDRDDLNGDYVIGESGQVRLPRIGIFSARSKTTAELERDIRAAVESKGEKLGYFSIEVIRCRPFYIVGLVNRPGPYPFLPGLTVVHAVALAGGLYRSSESAAQVMSEKRELTEITGRLAEAMARRARLEAELDGSQIVTLPKELVHLEPLRVREIAATEHAALDRSRQALSGEKSGLERLIALKQRETESYEREIVRLGQRIDEQRKTFTQLQKLYDDRVINQQRYIEAVITLDGLLRDKQTAIVGLSQANTELEKARKELAQLTLASNARIAKEITDTEFEITRLKRIAEQFGNLETLAEEGNSGPLATYKIMRRNAAGRSQYEQANETTPIMPGDVIEVEFIGKREGFF